jgi:hypothetical protein
MGTIAQASAPVAVDVAIEAVPGATAPVLAAAEGTGDPHDATAPAATSRAPVAAAREPASTRRRPLADPGRA